MAHLCRECETIWFFDLCLFLLCLLENSFTFLHWYFVGPTPYLDSPWAKRDVQVQPDIKCRPSGSGSLERHIAIDYYRALGYRTVTSTPPPYSPPPKNRVNWDGPISGSMLFLYREKRRLNYTFGNWRLIDFNSYNCGAWWWWCNIREHSSHLNRLHNTKPVYFGLTSLTSNKILRIKFSSKLG